MFFELIKIRISQFKVGDIMKHQLITLIFLASALTACGQQNDRPWLASFKNYVTSIIETAPEGALTSTDINDIKWSLVNSYQEDDSQNTMNNGFSSPQPSTNAGLDALKAEITKIDRQIVNYIYRWDDAVNIHEAGFMLLASKADLESYDPTNPIKILKIDLPNSLNIINEDRDENTNTDENIISGSIQTIRGTEALSLLNELKAPQPQLANLSIGQTEAFFLLRFEDRRPDPENKVDTISYITTLIEERDGILTTRDIPIQEFLLNSTPQSSILPNPLIFRNR